jgi:diguanylate cyclase (GGDEF)-like protein
MNVSVLPDFLAIGGLVAVFWSLLKRTRQSRLRYWLVGWVLVLVHIVAQFISQNVAAAATPAIAVSLIMLLLTSMAFIWAGNDMRRQPTKRDLPATLLAATPDAVLYACLVYGVTDKAIYFALTTAGLLATLWVFRGGRRSSDRSGLLLRPVAIFSVYALQALLLYLDRTDSVLNWSLCWHYLAVAIFFRMGSTRSSVGVLFTTISFLAWALVFPVGLLFHVLLPHVQVEHEVWNLPKFLVATGLIFTLLEEQMAKAEHASLHDALTGLPNRRLFLQRLEVAIADAQRNRRSLALVVIDLNDFKQVNDSLGHAVGDALLRQISSRFASSVREQDTLARLGGDEFAVILVDGHGGDVAQRVMQSLHAALGSGFEVDGHRLRAQASIGMSLYPDEGEDETQLYAFADRDMYRQKLLSRSRLESVEATGGSISS